MFKFIKENLNSDLIKNNYLLSSYYPPTICLLSAIHTGMIHIFFKPFVGKLYALLQFNLVCPS